MKFLTLAMLLLGLLSLKVLASETESHEDILADQFDPETDTEEDTAEPRNKKPLRIPAAELPKEQGATEGQNFDAEKISQKLKEEMDYLELSAENNPVIVAKPKFVPEPVEDLEERVNFRAAAVKKEDNLRADEVDASLLDGEIFE